MPALDHLIADFDDDFAPTIETPPVPTATSGKRKKKGKKHARAKLEDDEETSYPKSVTPSPPTQSDLAGQGVSLLREDAFTETSEGGTLEPGPPPLPAWKYEEEPILYEELELVLARDPVPAPEPAQPSPVASPAARSPQPADASLAITTPTFPSIRHAVPASVTRPSPRPARAALYGSPGEHNYPPNFAPQTQQRRSSLVGQARYAGPPPPHMPQAHYYGLPDLGLDFGRKPKPEQGKLPGQDGYCCCFDSFADAGDAASAKKAKDALLVGWEGGLDVYRVLPDKMEVVGRLEGLRGGVVGAKILPWTHRYDGLAQLRPIVAVIIHGAMEDDARDSGATEPPTHYQTTVEVFSLQTQQHVATLYRSLAVPVAQPSVVHFSPPPGPIGDLYVDAKGRFVTVSSGKSGEIFVFACGGSQAEFYCIGKYWTTLQARVDQTARPTSSNEAQKVASQLEERRTIPILSVSPRWLAIVPPATSSKISIQGVAALTDETTSPPDLATHVAPAQPPVTCDIVGLDAEGMLGRLSRQGAQNLIKASQKAIEMVQLGWRELNHPTPSHPQHNRTSSAEDGAFPPTNAPIDDLKRLSKEPALVSVIDFERLATAAELGAKYPPPPLATFALTEGCNYLSFSPGGLRLLTTSRSGELSTVWDLTRAAHGSKNRDRAEDVDEPESANGPSVRHVMRIPRSSQSVVLDSAWSRDGDMLALVTAHGTVHLHEMRISTTTRKRKRRRSTVSEPAPEKAEPTVSVSQGLSPPSSNGFLSNVKSTWNSVSGQVNAARSASASGAAGWGLPTSFAGIKQATSAARDAGGRMLATGVRQGYSAAKSGASDMWHADDNKIRHKELLDPETGWGGLRWVRRKSCTSLAVVCGGKVHLHSVQRVTRQRGEETVTGLRHERYGRKGFPLPLISTGKEGVGGKGNTCADQGPHGFWSLRQTPAASQRGSLTYTHTTLPLPPANEVETNPPYCPFHVDKRVSLYAFSAGPHRSQPNTFDHDNAAAGTDETLLRHYGSDDGPPWLFGDRLPPSMKMNERTLSGKDDFSEGVEDADMEGLADGVESRLTIQPAGRHSPEQIQVRTRRKRSTIPLEEDGEGEGGFDVLEDGEDGDLMC